MATTGNEKNPKSVGANKNPNVKLFELSKKINLTVLLLKS
jgi:hypothetical protein